MIKVSILVPTYGAEKFIEECLDSLVNQTLKEIEIICINDGSPDKSLDFIKKYAKQDKRIKIIDKPNTGYGDSMNKGLAIAKGEYIGIVEPDDFIDTNAFEKMYKVAKENNLEVVKTNFYEYMTDKNRDITRSSMILPEEEGLVLNPREHRHIFYEQPSIWSAIYERQFLKENDIDFLPTPGASYQDAGFNFKVWASASRVMMVDWAFLHYRQDNPNSSIKSDGKVYSVCDEYNEVERWLKEKGLYEEYGQTLVGMRLSSYAWNMDRLTRKTAKTFSKTIKSDLARLKKEGMLNPEKLDDVSRYNLNRAQIKHPRLYLNTRLFAGFGSKMKRVVSKTLKTLFPRYKQRLHTLDLLSELTDIQEDLERKVAKLEDKVKELEKEKKN